MKLADIEAKVVAKTNKAVLVTTDDENRVWLPLSQIEIHQERGKSTVTITMPETLAIEKELV
ncbi:MAG: hypothetical protein AB7F96_15475 [Beijerinckiaceae bacterium]